MPVEQRSVTAPNGKPFFGEVSAAVAEKLGVNPGEIRLLNGFETGRGGFGLRHIEGKANRLQRIKAFGFSSAERFVWHICQNFDHICEGNGRLGLCCHHQHYPLVAYIEWRAERGFWSIATAFPPGSSPTKILVDLRTG